MNHKRSVYFNFVLGALKNYKRSIPLRRQFLGQWLRKLKANLAYLVGLSMRRCLVEQRVV